MSVGSQLSLLHDEEIERWLINRMQRKSGQDLSPEMWIMKLLLGPIDTSYDSKGALDLGCRGWTVANVR